jgi:hypothetical protein
MVARSSSTTAKFKTGRLLGSIWFINDWHIRKLDVVSPDQIRLFISALNHCIHLQLKISQLERL